MLDLYAIFSHAMAPRQFWSSGLAMAHFLSKADRQLGARCLELGAGLGLVGLAAARYLHAQVVLSDLEVPTKPEAIRSDKEKGRKLDTI